MRHISTLCLLLLCVPRLVAAWQLWMTWDLDLGGHAPPQEFVLTVTSPTDTPVPPPLRLSYKACQLDHPDAGKHCAAIGCPAKGVYDFVVVAVYPAGTSAPSNTVRCTVHQNQCGCTEVPATLQGTPAPVAQQPPPAPPLDTTPPKGLNPTPPPLPQQTPEGLHLQPVGELPPVPKPPPVPAWTPPPRLAGSSGLPDTFPPVPSPSAQDSQPSWETAFAQWVRSRCQGTAAREPLCATLVQPSPQRQPNDAPATR